jgi:hypothetical protein
MWKEILLFLEGNFGKDKDEKRKFGCERVEALVEITELKSLNEILKCLVSTNICSILLSILFDRNFSGEV